MRTDRVDFKYHSELLDFITMVQVNYYGCKMLADKNGTLTSRGKRFVRSLEKELDVAILRTSG